MRHPEEAPDNRIQQFKDRGDLPEIMLKYGAASVTLCLQGAHITAYKPDGKTELLWLSESANFASEKAIRGGIPICWPWFGAHPERADRAQHGFARVSDFELVASSADEESTRITLKLASTPPYPEWQNCVELEFEIRLSDQLWMEIRTTNIGEEPIDVGAALHTYFQVSDVSQIQIPELKGLEYKDKTRDFQTFNQSEDLVVQSEADRVYLNPPQAVSLIDPASKRKLKIQSWGNNDLVVWNPWIENAQAMADFDDQGYKNMVCIEPANSLENRVALAPSMQHRFGKSICLN